MYIAIRMMRPPDRFEHGQGIRRIVLFTERARRIRTATHRDSSAISGSTSRRRSLIAEIHSHFARTMSAARRLGVLHLRSRVCANSRRRWYLRPGIKQRPVIGAHIRRLGSGQNIVDIRLWVLCGPCSRRLKSRCAPPSLETGPGCRSNCSRRRSAKTVGQMPRMA